MEIRGVVKYWLINYLSNRKIRCKIQHGSKECKSDYYDMSIGTPEGSCLGTIAIFNIHKWFTT